MFLADLWISILPWIPYTLLLINYYITVRYCEIWEFSSHRCQHHKKYSRSIHLKDFEISHSASWLFNYMKTPFTVSFEFIKDISVFGPNNLKHKKVTWMPFFYFSDILKKNNCATLFNNIQTKKSLPASFRIMIWCNLFLCTGILFTLLIWLFLVFNEFQTSFWAPQ